MGSVRSLVNLKPTKKSGVPTATQTIAAMK